MSANPGPGWQKYAWCQVERMDPPKRDAADRVLDFQATTAPYSEDEASAQASRCIQCPNPNCVSACPLETPIVELLALTAERQFKEAAELLFSANTVPEIASHICVGGRVCENACVLTGKTEAVPIRSITRFLLDYGWKHGLAEPEVQSSNGQRVVVIGSGICGLVGADALSRLGYSVTVIDSRHKPGGRMVNGLPGFRMDKALVERRVEMLKQRGIQFRMGVVCGRDVELSELQRDFDAVFLGFGRSEAVPLEIPGAKLRGVHAADAFLLQHIPGSKSNPSDIQVANRRVLVLGGGDTAMDALRTAIRCGASEAVCVYRRDAANLAADTEEYANAVEEGAKYQFLSQPIAVLGNLTSEVTAVRCVRTELAERDSSGRFGVKPISGSEFNIPADVVLYAYGFTAPRLPRSGGFTELSTDIHGQLLVDATQMTNLPGIFASGSIVCGQAPLAEVVRDARRTAAAIDVYLSVRRRG